jgi:hypothetical protein
MVSYKSVTSFCLETAFEKNWHMSEWMVITVNGNYMGGHQPACVVAYAMLSVTKHKIAFISTQ